MPDLHGQLTPQGNLNGTLNTIVYADNYNVLENKPSINSVTLQGNKTASDLGLATPEDITVTSVNGETGAVVLDGSDINYDPVTTINNKIDDLQSQITNSGVLAVNGKTGVVILTGADINYSAGVTINSKIDAVEQEIPSVSYPVTSVNSKTGAVVLDGSDIAYDVNNTVNEKIAAVESEIPTVDYPVTSVNELTGDVELTAGDIPLGTDFTDPTSTAGALGDLTTLTTTDKSSAVGAINEVNTNKANKNGLFKVISGTANVGNIAPNASKGLTIGDFNFSIPSGYYPIAFVSWSFVGANVGQLNVFYFYGDFGGYPSSSGIFSVENCGSSTTGSTATVTVRVLCVPSAYIS